MAEAAALKKLEDQLNCLVCLDTYTDPKQLQCHHVFCRQCLVRLVVRDQQGQLILTCPSCRQVTPVPAKGVAGLQSAFHINHLLDILEEHKKAKEGALYCADHQERELELCCETCEKLICLECSIEKHRNHEYDLVKKVLGKHKQEIKAALAPAEQQLTAACKALEGVDMREKEIFDQQATLEAKIHKESQQLVDAIKARTDQHISKLRHITEQKLRDLASQREQIETIKTQLSSYLNMVGETLTSGGQGEVMKVKSKDVLAIAASFQLDTLEPITQADMEFVASSKALEVCQSYGEVFALGSPDPSRCLATGNNLEVATVGERASVFFQAFKPLAGQPCSEPIKSSECELVSEITGTRTRGSIERRGQSQYMISYQPTIKGRHQLHIKVEGQHIRGSPFSVAVKTPVETLGTPILTIGGVANPWGVAINKRGEMVVTEWEGDCVSVFSPSGEKLRSFGTRGFGQSQFGHPTGVVVDGEGNILVVDGGNHHIQKFTADGQFLTAVGTKGSGPLQFSSPMCIAVNSKNNKVYVGDRSNNRVQVLNFDLTFFSTFGKKGSGKGQLNFPLDIACDSTGNVYVADDDNHRIQVFTAEGQFLRMFGRWGKGKGELNHPVGVAIDISDMVYVSDCGNCRVCVFTSEGQFVTSFGKDGKGPGEFDQPCGVAVDSSGVLYVCDWINNRLQLF